MPETQHYMTYEGSTTHPGCWETTVWIILNRPIYITKQEVRPNTAQAFRWPWSSSRPQSVTCSPARLCHPVKERTTATIISGPKIHNFTQTPLPTTNILSESKASKFIIHARTLPEIPWTVARKRSAMSVTPLNFKAYWLRDAPTV